MKKIAIVMFVVSSALAACGKKKAPEAPTTPAGDMGSAAAGSDTGSAAAGSDTTPPAEGGGEAGSGGGM
jgi:hypothetical protein